MERGLSCGERKLIWYKRYLFENGCAMRVVNQGDLEWISTGGSHRSGGLIYKMLLLGEDNSPENYWFILAKSDGQFYSPRHRHNFDQFRMPLQGHCSVDPKKYLEVGEIGYFPEGASYGPQQDTEE